MSRVIVRAPGTGSPTRASPTFRRDLPVIQRDGGRQAGLEPQPAFEEGGAVERTVDQAFQPAGRHAALVDRNIDQEPRARLTVPDEVDQAGRGGPRGPQRAVDRLRADRFGIHVVAQRTAIADRIGQQIGHRRQQAASGFGARMDAKVSEGALRDTLLERAQLAGADRLGPADPPRPARLTHRLDLSREQAETFLVHFVERGEQRRSRAQIGGGDIGLPLERSADRRGRVAQGILALCSLAALDERDAEKRERRDRQEHAKRKSARVLDQPGAALLLQAASGRSALRFLGGSGLASRCLVARARRDETGRRGVRAGSAPLRSDRRNIVHSAPSEQGKQMFPHGACAGRLAPAGVASPFPPAMREDTP